MVQDEKKSTRRVSFAPEPQINYIYRDEYSSNKTSSSVNDIPMDITTNLNEFKSLNLFQPNDQDEFNDLDDPYDGNQEEQLQEYQKYAQSYSKRCSLDPIRARKEMNQDHRITGDILVNEPKVRQSIGNEFNETGIMNSSYTVEELVNTVDIRRLVPQNPENQLTISQYLMQNGIRFLDDTVVENMKRDTLSKSRNIVDPALIIYYKYCLKERIDFLYNFSTYIIEQMNDIKNEIDELQDRIDVADINKENLKRIRNESRNKSKIDWYGIRKIYEIQFNKRMIENKNKVVDIFNTIKKENERKKELINQKKNSIGLLKERILSFKEKLSGYDKNKIIQTEKLQKMIEDRKLVLEKAKVELEVSSRDRENNDNKGAIIDKEISNLKHEVENLKKTLVIKNITESQLNDIKKSVQRYKTIFGIKLLMLDSSEAVFEIYGNGVKFNLTNNTHSIVLKESDPFFELAAAITTNENSHLKNVIGTINRFAIAVSLKKEVNLLKEKHRIELFYVNKVLYLRVMLDVNKTILDYSINSNFDLFQGECFVNNLMEFPGILTKIAMGNSVI